MNGLYAHLEKRMHSAISEQKILSDDSRGFTGRNDSDLKFSNYNLDPGKIHVPDLKVEQFVEFSGDSGINDTRLTKKGGIVSVVTDIHKQLIDPLPREKCKILHYLARLIRGYESGSIALTALSISTLNASVDDRKKRSSRMGYANNILEKAMPEDVESVLYTGDIRMLTGCHSSSSTMRKIRSELTPLTIWRKHNPDIIIQQSGKYVKGTKDMAMGGSAYSGMAILLDLLIETGKGALVSKPKIGYMMAANLAWSAGKKFKQYSAERKAIESCRKKQWNSIYKKSVAVLDHLL